MNLAGIFIVPDHASVQIINVGDTGPWKMNWISITRGPASLFTLKTFIYEPKRETKS